LQKDAHEYRLRVPQLHREQAHVDSRRHAKYQGEKKDIARYLVEGRHEDSMLINENPI
jgi:hypothetical protein